MAMWLSTVVGSNDQWLEKKVAVEKKYIFFSCRHVSFAFRVIHFFLMGSNSLKYEKLGEFQMQYITIKFERYFLKI